MGSFEIEPSQPVTSRGADTGDTEDHISPAERELECEPARSGGGLDPNLVDIIGRGLLGRHYGVVYDPASTLGAGSTADRDVEQVVDLTAPSPRRSRVLRARWRAFTTYWRGDLLSMIGDHFTLVALPIATDHLTHSGFDVGVVVSVGALATVAFGSLAGTFADRHRCRPLMIGCDLARAAILVILAVLDITHHPNLAALELAAFGLGALRLLSDGARSALVADLVPNELDVRSNNRLVLSENIGSTIGPVVAGLVIAGGLWRAFGIDAVSFVCSAGAIALVGRIIRRDHLTEREPPPRETEPKGSYRDESRAAFRAITDDVVFRRALVVITLFNITSLPITGQFITLARQTLHMNTTTIGVMFAISGVAGIAAAPFVERDHIIRPGAIAVSTGTCGAAILLVGIIPTTATVAIAFVVGGASFTFMLTHWSALRQRRFPVEQQGRVTLTTRRVMYTSILLGALAGGWLGDAAKPKALWLACGATGVAAAVWGVAVGLNRVTYD